MARHINSAMDSEVAEQTSKYLRIAVISSTGSGELFENFTTAVATSEGTIEAAIARAIALYLEQKPAH
jgi:imidazole glycerol phosphate synthase subunit HisF